MTARGRRHEQAADIKFAAVISLLRRRDTGQSEGNLISSRLATKLINRFCLTESLKSVKKSKMERIFVRREKKSIVRK